MHQENELVPYPERVAANFRAWVGAAPAAKRFTPEQLQWLELIRDHIAANLHIDLYDFELAPFDQRGGLGRVNKLFGPDLQSFIDELNKEVAA